MTASPMLASVVAQRCSFAQPAFGLMFVERHLDMRFQFAGFERFQNKAIGFGGLGAFQRRAVGMRGQVDHRHIAFAANLLRRRDAIQRAGQPNIHQHELRMQVVRQGERLLAVPGTPGNNIPQALQLDSQIRCHDGFVFHNKNSCTGHDRLSSIVIDA